MNDIWILSLTTVCIVTKNRIEQEVEMCRTTFIFLVTLWLTEGCAPPNQAFDVDDDESAASEATDTDTGSVSSSTQASL